MCTPEKGGGGEEERKKDTQTQKQRMLLETQTSYKSLSFFIQLLLLCVDERLGYNGSNNKNE
jgi:hypothetical protein